MTKKNTVELDASLQANKKLADNWLWNPSLIADVTHAVSQTIRRRQTVQSEDFHHLTWCRSDGKSDVVVEIRDGTQSLLMNADRYRSHQERFGLEGIAARYGLQLGEFTDDC
tara:strand:+ start:471 stop:806 length:336 start_codon:yes stop_codon:yes gene_type:complete